jgi:hypothetical protein
MLVVERFKNGAWEEAGRRRAGEAPGSMSDNGDDGSRQLVLFECKGEYSRVYRLGIGLDQQIGGNRLISNPDDVSQEIARLRVGEEFTISIKHDGSPDARTYRFREI